LLLVAVDQASQRVLAAGEVALERVTASGRGVRGAEGLQPPADLGLDQRWVVEQSEHAFPDELVDLWQADGSVLADAAFGAAVPVGAGAAVVLAQEPVLVPRRAAVVRVAALTAGEDPCSSDGRRVLRGEKRLSRSSSCWTSANRSAVTSAGTAIGFHSSGLTCSRATLAERCPRWRA
jgi:hypothetical protein